MQPFTQKLYYDVLSAPTEIEGGSLKLFIKENALIYLLYNEFKELKLCKAIYNSQELSLSLFLRFVFEKETILNQKLTNSEVISSSKKFTLIPEKLYSTRDAYHYASILLEESIFDDEIFVMEIDSKLRAIFISQPHLHHILEEYLPGYRLAHISAYNYHLSKKLSSYSPTHLLIHIYDDIALITAYKSGNIALSNCFEYRTGAGILYFIQSVKNILEADDNIDIYVIGDTDTSVAWYQEVKQKLPNTQIPSQERFTFVSGLDEKSYWEFAYLI